MHVTCSLGLDLRNDDLDVGLESLRLIEVFCD